MGVGREGQGRPLSTGGGCREFSGAGPQASFPDGDTEPREKRAPAQSHSTSGTLQLGFSVPSPQSLRERPVGWGPLTPAGRHLARVRPGRDASKRGHLWSPLPTSSLPDGHALSKESLSHALDLPSAEKAGDAQQNYPGEPAGSRAGGGGRAEDRAVPGAQGAASWGATGHTWGTGQGGPLLIPRPLPS